MYTCKKKFVNWSHKRNIKLNLAIVNMKHEMVDSESVKTLVLENYPSDKYYPTNDIIVKYKYKN